MIKVVLGLKASMAAETLPGLWSRVKRSASGIKASMFSSAISPPRIPVSQSCTTATRLVPVLTVGSTLASLSSKLRSVRKFDVFAALCVSKRTLVLGFDLSRSDLTEVSRHPE